MASSSTIMKHLPQSTLTMFRIKNLPETKDQAESEGLRAELFASALMTSNFRNLSQGSCQVCRQEDRFHGAPQ